MATITVKLSNICTGGAHGTFTVSGDVNRTKIVGLENMQDEIAALDDETILAVLFRLHKIGKTKAQFISSVKTGFTVTI